MSLAGAALAWSAELGAPAVVVFASERIGSGWVESYFGSDSGKEPQYNECETKIGEELTQAGLSGADTMLSDKERAEARAMKTVFDRYRDISGMPNHIMIKAGQAIDENARAVVACRVRADTDKKPSDEQGFRSCAIASCKGVDVSSVRRIATASGSLCLYDADRTTAGIAAIKGICSNVGKEIGRKLADNYIPR